MNFLLAIFVVLAILVVVSIALVMVVTGLALFLAAAGATWLAWRFLPAGRRFWQSLSPSPVDQLTDHYVSGHIDIGEFERRISRVLVRR